MIIDKNIALDVWLLFNKKKMHRIREYVIQKELMQSLVKSGYSRSYAYLSLMQLERDFKMTNGDVVQSLLEVKPRHEVDGRIGWCYKLNPNWESLDEKTVENFFVNGVYDRSIFSFKL